MKQAKGSRSSARLNVRRVKPGWYVLLAVTLYAVFMTFAVVRGNRTVRDLRTTVESQRAEVREAEPFVLAPAGLWTPVPGSSVPQEAAYLPNAPRIYRQGVNQGFDFYSEDASVPIVLGTPVIAAQDATVTRADHTYAELDPDAWQQLLTEVSQQGASEEQLNVLRGRQVWLETEAGRELRYAHLSAVPENLTVGQRVYRGQVVGQVGNSGTEDAVNGTSRGVRLHFEVWEPDGTFFGEGMEEAEVRAASERLFVGP